MGLRRLGWICALLLLLSATAADARSWDDLDSTEHEIYGREREEKLPLRLFFVQREKWEGHDALHIFWLWAYKDYPLYKSHTVFPFYYDLASKMDNRYMLLSPVYYREIDGKTKAQSLLWLAYWGHDTEADSAYHSLIPLYYASHRGAGTNFLLTPLFWYSKRSANDITTAPDVSFGAPIIPLMMWSSSTYETDLILFYLIRYRSTRMYEVGAAQDARPGSDRSARMREVSAAQDAHPGTDRSARIREVGAAQYAHPGNERSNGDSLLSYALPLYYYSRDGENTFGAYLIPLIWTRSSPTRSSWLIFPLFYSGQSENGNTTLSPLYIHLNQPNDNLQVILPLYLSYRSKDYSLHVNATGISLSEERLTSLPVSAEVNSERLLIDWDLGWFYNLFRVSSRDSVRFAAPEAPAASETAATTAPAVSHKRLRTRADSENFFGLYLLFGASAYERADHYRHFRLLPLSWLTWDTKSDNGVQTIIPFYVHYKDDESHYLVFFPVYGSQQQRVNQCSDEKSAWLLILYWNELTCNENLREQTLAWPLVNWYDSPARGGFRIFPLYWHRWRLADGIKTTTHFSPLHHTRITNDNFSTVSWLFYRSRDDSEKTFGVWGLLHLADSHDGLESTTYILPVWYHKVESAPMAYTTPQGQYVPRARVETWFTVAGLFWNYRQVYRDGESFLFQLSPLHLMISGADNNAFYSWLFYRSDTKRHNFFGVPLLFHHDRHHDGGYSNLYVFPYYQSVSRGKSAAGEFDETVRWIFPLYYGRSTPETTVRFIGGYYYERREKYASDNFMLLAGRTSDLQASSFSWHALLYTFWYDRTQSEKSFKLLYGIGGGYWRSESAFSWHFALISGYKHVPSTEYVRHHLLPLWWHSRTGGDTNLYLPFLLAAFTNHGGGNRIFRAVALGILYYESSDREAYEQTLAVALGIIYYHNKYPERRFDSYGSLYGLLWHYETEENYKRFSFLTFLYIRTETENGVRHRILGIPF